MSVLFLFIRGEADENVDILWRSMQAI